MRRSMHQFFKAQLRDKFRALGTPRAKKYFVNELTRADHLPAAAPGREIEVFRLFAMRIHNPSVREGRQLLSASETAMLPDAHHNGVSELIIFSIHCRLTDRFVILIIAWENCAVNDQTLRQPKRRKERPGDARALRINPDQLLKYLLRRPAKPAP